MTAPSSFERGRLHSVPIALKIPNQEVKELYEGFFSQWLTKPRNLEALNQTCGSIIANQIFSAILTKDIPTLTRIVPHHPSFADMEDWRFHFLDIAAMVGDKKIFELLLKNYEKLMNVRDKEGLGVGDYAFLGGTNFSFFSLQEEPTLSAPNTLEEVICWKGGKIILSLGLLTYPAKKIIELGLGTLQQQINPFSWERLRDPQFLPNQLKTGIISGLIYITDDFIKRHFFCSILFKT